MEHRHRFHWPKVLFVPDSSSQKLAAPLYQVTGNSRARTPPSLVEERPHWTASAPVFRTQYGWLLRPLQPAIPRRCCWRGADAAQQARKEFCTETPPPPAGPHPATIRHPADCPVCGKHCSCRASVVTHMVNACGITRPFMRCGEFDFRGEPRPPEIPLEPPLSTLVWTRARDGAPTAPPPRNARPSPKSFLFSASYNQQNGLGFHHQHFRNQGCPPTSGRRPREYDDLAATTPFQCISCGPKDQTKSGLLPQMRAHERPKAEPQQAPKIAALLQRPFCDKQAGNTGGLATHMHGKSISTARRARRQKWR
ncbi:hypothetical protein TCSYLVIO_006261 [Trypanosoma cruzi]|nr:hypothetical protein TCSYLVIO_006261 [Trypanosoma cruzi]